MSPFLQFGKSTEGASEVPAVAAAPVATSPNQSVAEKKEYNTCKIQVCILLLLVKLSFIPVKVILTAMKQL